MEKPSPPFMEHASLSTRHFIFGRFQWYRKLVGGFWFTGPATGEWYLWEEIPYRSKTEDYRKEQA